MTLNHLTAVGMTRLIVTYITHTGTFQHDTNTQRLVSATNRRTAR